MGMINDLRFPPCECVPVPEDYCQVTSMARHIAELKLSRDRHPAARGVREDEYEMIDGAWLKCVDGEWLPVF